MIYGAATQRRERGFSLLELVVVVVLIGFLAAAGIKYYLDAADRARALGVEMLAWRFAETVAVLRGWGKIPPYISHHKHGTDNRGVSWVRLEKDIIYLNENGWPANTDMKASPAIGDQTAEECEQLLNAMFELPVDDLQSPTLPSEGYDISVIDGRVCRYQLAQVKEEAWFFDYSLESGRVQMSVPRFRIEQNTHN